MTPRWKRACLRGRRFRRRGTAWSPTGALLHQELKKPGVTLALLWHGVSRGRIPTGTPTASFASGIAGGPAALKPSMRQVHRAGEKLFVDYSGKRPHLVDPQTGEEVAVELFVGVLGASGLIYAEATRGQDLPSWIGAHVAHAGRTFRAVPAIWVPDNLKSGVTTASRYEPEINRTYAELARHYGAVVIPARVATPTDKPKVEVSVQIAQRWVLAALRHRTFFTLADLNAAIGERVDAINDRPMKVTGVSRRGALRAARSAGAHAVAAHALRAGGMAAVSREHRLSRRGRPQLLQRAVSAGARARRGALHAGTVEVFFKAGASPSHARLTGRGRFATQAAHMPRAHRAHAEWTPSRLIAWADQSGPATGRLVAGILAQRPHPEQGYRACLGLMRLGRLHGADRLDAACDRAERLRSYRYRTVEHILIHQQDRLPLEDPAPARPALTHENVRGATYYEEAYADAPDDREAPRLAPDRDGHGV